MFRHPNYYKELRKRNKTDQAISKQQATASSTRSPGSGLKHQASSAKLTDPQATSDKHQAPRHKRQA